MFDEPKRRPTVDDLLLDLWFDNFVGRDECNEDWEFDIDVEACSELTPAQEVHHILPLSRGGTHDDSNLMALCKPCHSEITARDGDRWHTR